MDISSLSTTLSYINTANSFGTNLLKKELNQEEVEGHELSKLIKNNPTSLEHMVNPAIGGNIDIYL